MTIVVRLVRRHADLASSASYWVFVVRPEEQAQRRVLAAVEAKGPSRQARSDQLLKQRPATEHTCRRSTPLLQPRAESRSGRWSC